MGISMDCRLPNCSLSGSELNSPRCLVAIGQWLLRLPSLTVSLAAIKLNCGIGYCERLLFHSETTIQLLIVTAGPSFIDFFKALLAETSIKRL